MVSRPRMRQTAFAYRTRGGARKGAGRPPKGRRPGVHHRRREALARHTPVHVTLSVRSHVSTLRNGKMFRALERAFVQGCDRFSFRLTHYSVQTNHMHLLVEASDATALSRGMQGLAIRMAKAVNRVLGAKGKVFADRYHARALKTPREVRRALAYVLLNARRHHAKRGDAVWPTDPCSSARHFDGWRSEPPVGITP